MLTWSTRKELLYCKQTFLLFISQSARMSFELNAFKQILCSHGSQYAKKQKKKKNISVHFTDDALYPILLGLLKKLFTFFSFFFFDYASSFHVTSKQQVLFFPLNSKFISQINIKLFILSFNDGLCVKSKSEFLWWLYQSFYQVLRVSSLKSIGGFLMVS